MRTHLPHRTLVQCAALVYLCAQYPCFADDTDRTPTLPYALLEKARDIITSADRFIGFNKNALLSKLAILDAITNLRTAVDTSRSIESPVYSSLAIGAIAAIEARTDPQHSVEHYREALARARDVKPWAEGPAESLSPLFELLPDFPAPQSHQLLLASREAFDAWEKSDYVKSDALLALSKATTVISPQTAKSLLYDIALKSAHYFASIEYLSMFMARTSMENALQLSEAHYSAQRDWPCDQHFRRAVLLVLSETDFPRAFSGIKEMRKMDNEIAAARLVDFLLESGRTNEASTVIAYIASLQSEFRFTQDSLTRLRSRLQEFESTSTQVRPGTPEAIASYLQNPTVEMLRSFSLLPKIVFRNDAQIRDFIAVSLPLTDVPREPRFSHDKFPPYSALGLLTVCSTLINEIPQAIAISERIGTNALRAEFLLDAFAAVSPLPPNIHNWRIDGWRHTQAVLHRSGARARGAPDLAR